MRMRLTCCLWLLVAASVIAQDAPKPTDDPVQLKGTIVKLQAAVLERDREIARLNGQIAELQLAALAVAVKGMDPAVQQAAGVPPPPPSKTDSAEKAPPKN